MQNYIKTAILLAAIGGLFVTLGRILGQGTGMLIGGIIGFAITAGAYWFSDKLAIRSAGARPLGDDELPWLRQMVGELASAAKLPMPRLYISPSEQANAFATGRGPKHAAVAVTEGILRVLSPEELRGVLAHELGHVKNRDILISSVAAAFGTAISMLADFLSFNAIFGGGDDNDNTNPIVAIAVAMLAPISAAILQMALSRSREFAADETGAKLIHNGEPLAIALQKIEQSAMQHPMKVPESQAQAYIINPLSGFNLRKLFSTHPPTAERVERLRRMRLS